MNIEESKIIEALQGLRIWTIILHTPSNNGIVIHSHLTIEEAGDLFVDLNSAKRKIDTWYQMKSVYER